MTPYERLEAAAIALYGPNWQRPLERDLLVHRETLARWRRGKPALTRANPVFVALIRHMHARATEITLAAVKLVDENE